VLHRSLRWSLGFLVLVFPVAAFTEIDTPGLTKTYVWSKDQCRNEANELELSRCLDSAYRKAEAHLARTQREIDQRLDADKRKEFVRLIAAWTEFSQISCQFDSAGAAGSSVSSIYAGCMFDYTVFRIRQLEKYSYCLRSGDCGEPVLLHLIISPVKYGN
jgi:uncharacterized protein YecT (DUF1311 family)